MLPRAPLTDAQLQHLLRNPRDILRQLDKADSEESLHGFIKRHWDVLEPVQPFVDGWALGAICEHLEAVTYGEIKRLLINVPPGFMKSLATDVFWPAWEWGPKNLPSMRYVAFSYSAHLTERDNDKFRTLVRSEKYQSNWGDRVKISPTQFNIRKAENLRTGWKLATSVGGVGTGERGDRIICFPAEALVATEHGQMRIGDIVNERRHVRAWSFNERMQQLELKPIIRWFKNPGKQLVRVQTENGGSLVCTVDHKILTNDGYLEAQLLAVGDVLLASPRGMLSATLTESSGGSGRQIEMRPDMSVANPSNSGGTYSKFFGEDQSNVIRSSIDLPHHFFRQMSSAVLERAMTLGIVDILQPSSILKIIDMWVEWISVFMADSVLGRTWPNKNQHHHLMSKGYEGLSIFAHAIAGVSLAQGGIHNPPRNRHWISADCFDAHDSARNAIESPIVGDEIKSFKSEHITPDFVRVTAIDLVHEIPPATYCVTVQDNHNLCVGDIQNIICKNCDDPHNVKESESDVVREETVRWFRESVQTRMNNPDSSAIVVIMQRVHESDVSGTILANRMGYEHLNIPMHYDSRRHCVTSIGWEDPRRTDGELAFPERYSAPVVDQLANDMSDFAIAGQFEQAPTPRGGGILKSDWWKLWPPQGEEFDERNQPLKPLDFPMMDYIVASLDTAMTEEKENDYSAMTVLGVWHDLGQPKIMLMSFWQERLDLHRLVEKVRKTCRARQVDALLVEAKNNGFSVAQEIVRLCGPEEWNTLLEPVKGDKVARAYAVQHLLRNGLIYAPERGWSDLLIEQCASFPRGAHDDGPDSLIQALAYLRRAGLLVTREEHQQEQRALESRVLEGEGEQLYDV